MTALQTNFKRVEKKYLLSKFQYRELRKELEGMLEVDGYGETRIMNLYYDTPDFTLIRRSLDKPLYKEKLRLRTYGRPESEDTRSFLEIKKKFKGVVYKRRVALPYGDAMKYLPCTAVSKVSGSAPFAADIHDMDVQTENYQRAIRKNAQDARKEAMIAAMTEGSRQMAEEIDYLCRLYDPIEPRMMIAYDRIAMKGIQDPNIRITFDHNLTWRTDDLDLLHGGYGKNLLDDDQYLMEVKIMGGLDMKLAEIFSRLAIFPASFSKYGAAYQVYSGMTANTNMNKEMEKNKYEHIIDINSCGRNSNYGHVSGGNGMFSDSRIPDRVSLLP